MNNALAMGVIKWRSSKHAQIWTVYVLQRVKRRFGIVVILEHAHDVRMHQANTRLPILAKAIRTYAVAGESDRSTCQLVRRQPRLSRATGTQFFDQGVAVGKLGSLLEVYQMLIAHPVGSGTRTGWLTSTVSTKPVSAS